MKDGLWLAGVKDSSGSDWRIRGGDGEKHLEAVVLGQGIVITAMLATSSLPCGQEFHETKDAASTGYFSGQGSH